MRHQEFSALAAGYLPQLYNTARRMTRDTHEAEDLVQETYQRAFQTWRQLKDPAHCRAWLYQIMRNLFIDAHRRKRTMPELVLVEGGREAEEDMLSAAVLSLEEEVLQHLSQEEIRRALALLSEDLRTALLLCDVEGFTYPEIAQIMGCPVGTVRSRIARARLLGGRLCSLLGQQVALVFYEQRGKRLSLFTMAAHAIPPGEKDEIQVVRQNNPRCARTFGKYALCLMGLEDVVVAVVAEAPEIEDLALSLFRSFEEGAV